MFLDTLTLVALVVVAFLAGFVIRSCFKQGC